MAHSKNQNSNKSVYPRSQKNISEFFVFSKREGIQKTQGLTISPVLPAISTLSVPMVAGTAGFLLPTSGVDDKLLNDALNENITVNDRFEKRLVTTQQLNDIVNDIANHYQVKKNHAYIGLTATLQAGGTIKNKRSNVKITLGTITFESRKINEYIAKHCKNLTPRQFARCIANDVFYVAVRHNITGNAYTSLNRFYPNLLLGTNQHERFWAADFQVDNPNCPEYIRDALRQRYADKFTKKN